MTWEYALQWARAALILYILWRIMNRLNHIVTASIKASARSDADNQRLTNALNHAIGVLDTLEHRQEQLANSVEEKSTLAAQVVEANLGRIEASITENTALTIAAAEASATAAEVANHMNEKIVVAHDRVVETIKEMYQPNKSKKG